MELDDDVVMAPLQRGSGAGGPILVTDDEGAQLDFTQEFEPVGNIREMTARLKELQDMRAEDVRDGGGNRSGSPTEVMDVDSNSEPEQVKLSPLEALKKFVENMKETKNAEALTPGEPVLCDEYEMGRSEVQKLKFHVTGELKMPWEKGFAGLVLERKSSVLETKFLDEKTRAPHAIQVDGEVQPEIKKVEDAWKMVPSFKLDGGQKMPWSKAMETEREKVMEGWKIVIDEARKSCKAAGMLDQVGETVLDDIFAKKKNGALQVRLSAMMIYIRWARSKGRPPFPIVEAQVYQYVDQLRKDGAPATRANSFRSALAFCKGII